MGSTQDKRRAQWAASKRRKRLKPIDAFTPHGVASTYTNYGCRCERCREAETVRQRLARAAKRADLNGEDPS